MTGRPGLEKGQKKILEKRPDAHARTECFFVIMNSENCNSAKVQGRGVMPAKDLYDTFSLHLYDTFSFLAY